jgi:hypothetical protein
MFPGTTGTKAQKIEVEDDCPILPGGFDASRGMQYTIFIIYIYNIYMYIIYIYILISLCSSPSRTPACDHPSKAAVARYGENFG